MGSLTYDNALNTLIMEYNYYKSDSNEKLIAQTMLKNIRKISDYTIEQTAECCNISVSTCRRFIRQLGYNSYSEFRMHLKANIENIDIEFPAEIDKNAPENTPYLENYVQMLKGDLEQILQCIDKNTMVQAARLIHEHEHIFIHDLLKGGMRLPLERNLALDGKLVTMSYDYDSQVADTENISPDCLFLLSYDGKHSKIVLQTICKAKNKGASIIVISNAKIFTNSELCDIIIYTGAGSCTLSSMLLLDLTYQYLAELYNSMYFHL